jgi:hypothetical protein
MITTSTPACILIDDTLLNKKELEQNSSFCWYIHQQHHIDIAIYKFDRTAMLLLVGIRGLEGDLMCSICATKLVVICCLHIMILTGSGTHNTSLNKEVVLLNHSKHERVGSRQLDTTTKKYNVF